MSDVDDSSDDSSSLSPEDTLVGGRAKRVTAGNRLSHLLQHLDDDDVKADLLAEDEEDQKDYSASEAEDGDDALDSSDSSDDEGKEGQDDDLTGEKELKKQERVESKRKRKARELVRIQPLKKKVKIAEPVVDEDGETTPSTKKQDRPKPADYAPTRHSSRTQTIASARLTEAKVKESRKRAVKTQEMMRIAAEKRAAEAGPELTQADRMARALDIKKENSRSLNRWEKSEQERLRAQQEKLEAMRNRKLDGPVIRYWSGPVTWIWREGPDGHPVYARCKYLKHSKVKIEEAAKDRGDHTGHGEEADYGEQDGPHAEHISPQLETNGVDPKATNGELKDTSTNDAGSEDTQKKDPEPPDKSQHQHGDHSNRDTVDGAAEHPPKEPGMDSSFLDGIHVYASDDASTPIPTELPSQPSILVSNADEPRADEQIKIEQQQISTTGDPSHPDPSRAGASTTQTAAADQSIDDSQPTLKPERTEGPPPPDPHQSGPQPSTLPLHREKAARALLILDQFPTLPSSPPTRRANAATAPVDPALNSILLPDTHPPLTADQTRYLSTKPRKTASSSTATSALPAPPEKEACAISGKVARFLDPKTRLPYADMAASKAIQRVLANGCQYSALLGVWSGIVGEGQLGRVARGVPEGFWSGVVKEKVKDEGMEPIVLD